MLNFLFVNLSVLSIPGQTTLMVDPYPRTVSEPAIYGTVRVHAEYNTGDVTPRTDFSVSIHLCINVAFFINKNHTFH